MKPILLSATTMAISVVFASLSWGHSAMFPDGYNFDDTNEGKSAADLAATAGVQAAASTTCSGGSASGYLCKKIDLKAFVPKAELGGGSQNLNDIWGWTDPETGSEIAIVGRTHGTAFVDISNAENPVLLGFLPSADGTSSWRDMKVYNDHAFIVADGGGNRDHGLQIYDLRQLRDVKPGSTLSETAHLGGFGIAHNIAINEDTGYAYIVGSNQCSGGLYMADISDPTAPSYAGCFSSDGYTHDAQCVIYNGPDSRYTGAEICVAYNEDTITIVDVSNKSNPVQISRTAYSGARYTHQGWFLDDNQSILITDDELDESNSGVNTTSYIFDVSDLQNPVELGAYVGPTSAIDHNLYAKDGYVFETNYRAGLRIHSTEDIASGNMKEVAYFDTIPGSDSAQFSGTWSSYIYFESGNIVVSDIGNGLFVLAPDWEAINNPSNDDDDVPTPTYCNAAGRSVDYEWVSKVEIGDFENTSSGALYSDFTDQVISLDAGTSAEVTLTPDFRDNTYNEFWAIWIDFDQNKTFENSEKVFTPSASSSSAVSGTLTIPADAATGTTRMRVIMEYNNAPSACGSFNYGEVEDYSVEIQ